MTSRDFSRANLVSAKERREAYERQRVQSLNGENAGNNASRRVSTVYSVKTSSSAAPKSSTSKSSVSVVIAPSKQQSSDLAQMKASVAELKLQLQSEVSAREALLQELEQHKSTIAALTSARSSDEANMRNLKQQLEANRGQYETSLSSLNGQIESLKQKVAAQNDQISALESTHRQNMTHLSQLQHSLKLAQETSDEHESHANELSKQLENSECNLMHHQQLLREAQQQLRDAEMVRRRLHQEMQELRGNIRVIARVRPLLPSDPAPANIVFARDGTSLELSFAERRTNVHGEQQQGQAVFQFDKCFGPSATQENVFDEISHAVQSVLDGYSACIFTYGQTGCGKTYTMEGTETDRGMIPRSVELLFQTVGALARLGWEYSMAFTFVEIYNETLRDLLSAEDSGNIKISHQSDGTTILSNARTVPVKSHQDIFGALKQAARVRSTASTASNEHSSRSHSVFSLSVRGINSISKNQSFGVLHLVDLAGSERLAVSKSEGARLKETQAINKSLSALGDVIAALANQESFVPYRNSKLTYLLQNSLGGASSKTLMFVQLSPCAKDVSETLCTLKFAAKVNACEIGAAKKKTAKVDLNL